MPNITSATQFFPRAVEGFVTTLASTISAGATTLTANSTSGYSIGDVIVWIIDPSTSAKQVLTGTVAAGNQITNVVWTYGTNQTHTAGATIVDYTTATGFDLHSAGILKHANQDGSLLSGAVGAAIATNAITASMLSASAIKLGYTAITTNSSGYSGSIAAVTGLTATVTVPAGGRSIKVTLYTGTVSMSAAGTPTFSIWNGAVGTGTLIGTSSMGATSAYNLSMTTMAITTPAAGSVTFSAGLATSVGIATILATSTAPAFILVEAI